MNILIVNLGSLLDNIISTSVIKGILKKYKDVNISWVVKNNEDKYIFKYNKDVKRVLSFAELIELDELFDILINLNPFFPHQECKKLKVKNFLGFGISNEFDIFFNLLEGKEERLNISLFQMFYKLSGLTWRGEGYDLRYYPRSRSRRSRAGLGVAHANLREYVVKEIDVESLKLWYIPYKKSIFKKMNEINRCHKIITDDLMIFHLSMALRKYVYFLQTFSPNTKLELFGNGQIYQVPINVFT